MGKNNKRMESTLGQARSILQSRRATTALSSQGPSADPSWSGQGGSEHWHHSFGYLLILIGFVEFCHKMALAPAGWT